MIFKPVLIDRILAGHKTVTRRPWKGALTPPYEPGKVYGIQPGMARPSVARIKVLNVAFQQLGQIDDVDAIREGFADRAAFRAYWRGLYGGKWDGEQAVWRISFELVDVAATICPGCCGTGTTPVKPVLATPGQLELA
jgi:hypothetical protein